MTYWAKTRIGSAIALAVGIGWLATPAGGQSDVNTMCPVMTDEEADPGITVVYQGKTVAFCCDTCVVKFLNDPPRYLANLPQFASAIPAATGNSEKTPWLGRIHPAIVHFPIAGAPLALLGFLTWVTGGREAFAKADVPPLLIATAASVAAVLTGNIAFDNSQFSESMRVIAERHQFFSTTVMVLCLALTAVRVWRWNRLAGAWRWIYGVGLVAVCVLLGITGFLGGSLVFGPDHLMPF